MELKTKSTTHGRQGARNGGADLHKKFPSRNPGKAKACANYRLGKGG